MQQSVLGELLFPPDRRYGCWEGLHGESVWLEGDGVFRPHQRFKQCRKCGGCFWFGKQWEVYYERTGSSTPPNPYPRSYADRNATFHEDLARTLAEIERLGKEATARMLARIEAGEFREASEELPESGRPFQSGPSAAPE